MPRSLGLRIDPASDAPIYRQIVDQIASRIVTGTFPAGFKLPPTRTLAAEIAAHRNTVVRAYDELEASGMVETGIGRGTFVAARPAAVRPRSAPREAAFPWESLIANVSAVEPLRRFSQFARPIHGPEVVNLTQMQPPPDLLPVAEFRRTVDHVLKTRGSRALGYAPREGVPRLRALIAEDLERHGVPARAEDVIVTTGSQQAIDVIARMFVAPGDAFLVNRTTYSGAIDVLSAAGARLIGVPSDDEGPDLAALERLAGSRAKGIYLMPNCQNPTGEIVSKRRREALVEWSHRARIPIVEDDYGSDLVLDDEPLPPALRALDGDVIYIGTFSKRLIPALRIGFILCPPALRPHVTALKHAMDLGTSALLQHALAEFLERGYLRAHVRRVRDAYRERRDALEGALAADLPREIHWRSPRTGLLLWLPLPPGLTASEVTDEARRAGVLVASSAQFATGMAEEEGIRLAYCYEPPARLVTGAQRLATVFTKLTGSRQDLIACESVP